MILPSVIFATGVVRPEFTVIEPVVKVLVAMILDVKLLPTYTYPEKLPFPIELDGVPVPTVMF